MEHINYSNSKSYFNRTPSTILTAVDFKRKYNYKGVLGDGSQSAVYLCENNENYNLFALKSFKPRKRQFAIREYNILKYLSDLKKENNVKKSASTLEDDGEPISCSSSATNNNNHAQVDNQTCSNDLLQSNSAQEETTSLETGTGANDEGIFSTLLGEDMDIYEVKGELCFLQELGDIDLFYYLTKGNMTRQQKYSVMKQLTKTVKFLHQHDMLHRDIKLENILVTVGNNEKLHAKLIDYGLAASLELDEETELKRCCGSPKYQAPELIPKGYELYSPAIHTKAVDIFSMGVVFYALIYSSYPFKPITYRRKEINLYTNDILNEDDIEYAQSKGYPKELLLLIKDMLKLKCELRPSIEEIKNRLERIL